MVDYPIILQREYSVAYSGYHPSAEMTSRGGHEESSKSRRGADGLVRPCCSTTPSESEFVRARATSAPAEAVAADNVEDDVDDGNDDLQGKVRGELVEREVQLDAPSLSRTRWS